MKWFWFLLVMLALVGGERSPRALASPVEQQPPTIEALLSRRNCQSDYDGIVYCVEERGDIHVIIIDLENPYIRFEMVMADDVTRVDTDRRERIEDIVTRSPYQEQEVVAAVNADYFGRSHGPEGLTVKNGHRLDAEDAWDENPHALWRSSLAISRLNQVSLGRKSAEELADPRVFRERFYNAVGGGPLILNYGVVIPNAVACALERFPLGACKREIQTAAGLSEDGRWLYLAAGEGRDIQGFAELLRDYGAFTAIKLDGGGSSQLWYDGRMRHDTERAVGNALLVFYDSTPRHDAEIQSSLQVPVVEPGARVDINLEIRNTGSLDWEPDLGYRFKNVQGWPVVGPAYRRLPEAVPVSGSLMASLAIIAPRDPGVYEAEWQLTCYDEPIGPRLWLGLIVVPPGEAAGVLKEQIEAQVAEGRASQSFERDWPALRQELERLIWREVKAELRPALCDGQGGMMWGRWAPWLVALAC